MKVWMNIGDDIEIISYDKKFEEDSLNVRFNQIYKVNMIDKGQFSITQVFYNAFTLHENVSIGCEVNKDKLAQQELAKLCIYAAEDGVSLIARDKTTNTVVGFAFNKIQFPSGVPGEPSSFERFRDEQCTSPSAKSLMNYMITMDSKIDLFEYFKIETLFEIMFLAVLPKYRGREIGYKLCESSVQLAEKLKSGGPECELLHASIKCKRPKLVSALWTSNYSKKIGTKLGFNVILEESYDNFVFDGKPYSARISKEQLTSVLAARLLQ